MNWKIHLCRTNKMGYSSHPISRIISFIHALVVSTWAVHILTTRDWVILLGPEYEFDQSWVLMFKITTTYFCCDLMLMLMMPTKGDRMWIIHHIIGGSGLFSMWLTRKTWLVGLFFELTEISTIFLNITWVHIKLKITHLITFKVASALLILSYIVIRIWGGLLMFIYLYNFKSIILTWNLYIRSYAILGPTIIFILNIYWFYRLILKAREQLFIKND